MRLAVAPLLLSACFSAAAPDPIDPADCAPPVAYQIHAVDLPDLPRELGADLDGDRVIDNRLGEVFRTLQGLFDPEVFDLDARAAEHLASDTSWRLTVWTCPGDQRLAALTRAESVDPELRGELAGGTITATGEGSQLPLGALFDASGGGDPAFVDTLITRIELEESPQDLTAIVQVGLAPELTKDVVVRALAPFVNEHLTAFREDLDLDHDGAISLQELRDASITSSLLQPDLRLAGERPATSFAFRVHATRL